MAVTVASVDPERVARIETSEEGHFLERKSKRISPAKLTKAMSAFANADGGELYVGLEDGGGWDGFGSIEDANGHLQAFDSTFPLSRDFQYEFLASPNRTGYLLRASVFKTKDIKCASDGIAYVRRGARSHPCTGADELALLERTKGLTTHETQLIAYPLEELTNSLTTIEFMLNVIPESEPGPWLRKQHLVESDKATVAGTLLFHDEPQVHLPKAAVKVYRYATMAPEGTRETLAFDPVSIEGSIYSVIHNAVARTVTEVERIEVYTSEGLQHIQYPDEALHEIITNAVLHRDYAINDDVHVRIFDNRVEVESPGRLPAHITPDNILAERFARNPLIVRLINKFPNPPNKDVGEGLNTAFAAMKRLQLQAPIITERDSSVLVNIRHEKLASPESRVVEYLRNNSTINNSKAREITGVQSEGEVRRVFKRLVAAREIEQVPGTIKGGTLYRLPSREK
jgi:ATP-dependent DNA helicase RecG